MSQLMPFLTALAAASLGGIAAWVGGVPVPFLLGSSVAVAAAAVSGVRFTLPAPVKTFAFFVLGLQAGSGVTPAALEQVALWPLSFAALMLAVFLTVLVTFIYLTRLRGWDRQTAFFASLPGALSFVLAAAEETGADLRKVTMLQTIRLFLIIGLLVPVIAAMNGGTAQSTAQPMPPDAFWQFGLLIGCGIIGAAAGRFSRLPGGMMLGALLASAALFGASALTVRMPPVLANTGMIVLGMVIGGRFSGLRPGDIGALFPVSFYAFVCGTAAAASVGAALYLVTPIGAAKIALAFVPGAMEAMTVISFALGVDPAYVAAHHAMRFLFIALTVPFIARWLAAKNGR
jgi:uncharacterized protein